MIYLCCSDENKVKNKLFLDKLSKKYKVSENFEEANKKPAPIIVIGGDGTLNYLCNNLPDAGQFDVLYCPQGTANDFAKSLKLSHEINDHNIDNLLRNNAQVSIPVMNCNEQKFINVASLGEPARVTNDGTGLIKEYTGKLSYYLSAIDKLVDPEAMTLTFGDENEKFEVKTYGGFVSQGLFVGGGVRVNGHACCHFKETFNLSLVDSLNVVENLNCLLGMQTGSSKNSDCLIEREYKNLVISSKDNIKLKLDGESYEAKTLTFKKSELVLDFYLY